MPIFNEFRINYTLLDRVVENRKIIPVTSIKLAIQFAKLHVEAALKSCLEKHNHSIEEDYEFGSSEIMNSYPLTNIK